MILKIHQEGDANEVVGICDRELTGKTLTEGDLSITISDFFFGDMIVSEERVIEVLKNSGNITIFGERSVNLAIKHDVLCENDYKIIAGVPHAIILRL